MRKSSYLFIAVFLYATLLFFTGNTIVYCQETAALFHCTPIGWAENSTFAYIVEEQIEPDTDNPVGTIPVIYYVVQNMITDRVLEKSMPSSDINSFYDSLPDKIAEIKKKYSIIENRFDIYLLKQNTYIVDEESGEYILFEAERSNSAAGGPFSITATLQPENKKKVLSRINAEGLEIAGYVESPFEKRIALCVEVYETTTLQYDNSISGKTQNTIAFIGCHVEKFK